MIPKQRFRKNCILCDWRTVEIMGVPFLVCRRCGRSLPQAVKEKTITKQEIREMQKKPKYPKTTKEIIEDAWEKKYGKKAK